MKLRQSIQRWEYEGGALVPADSNVHFWRYRAPEPQKPSDDVHFKRELLEASRRSGPVN